MEEKEEKGKQNQCGMHSSGLPERAEDICDSRNERRRERKEDRKGSLPLLFWKGGGAPPTFHTPTQSGGKREAGVIFIPHIHIYKVRSRQITYEG